MPYLEILLFAAVAAVLFLRLRSVLGRRDESERPRNPVAPRAGDGFGNVVPLRRSLPPRVDETPLSLAQQIDRLRAVDPNFREEEFLRGARMAFQMIVEAFARGDLDTLRPLLGEQVFASFASAVRARSDRGEVRETRIERIEAADLASVELNHALATVTVRFVSRQVDVTRSAQGEVIEGDATQSVELLDLWCFQRDMRNNNPNWALVATRTA